MQWLGKVFSFPLVFLVRIYQLIISPLFPPTCRFTPSCSTYMLESLNEWGPVKGLYLGLKRIISCHPLGKHGHDPVPKRKLKK